MKEYWFSSLLRNIAFPSYDEFKLALTLKSTTPKALHDRNQFIPYLTISGFFSPLSPLTEHNPFDLCVDRTKNKILPELCCCFLLTPMNSKSNNLQLGCYDTMCRKQVIWNCHPIYPANGTNKVTKPVEIYTVCHLRINEKKTKYRISSYSNCLLEECLLVGLPVIRYPQLNSSS